MSDIYSKIQRAIDKLVETYGLGYEQKNGVHTVTSDKFYLVITLTPKDMGVEFVMRASTGQIVRHIEDNDLYNLQDKDNAQFIEDFGDDILALLDALQNQKLLFGYRKRKLSIIVPLRDQYLVISKGWILTHGITYKTLEKAKQKGEYTELKFSSP